MCSADRHGLILASASPRRRELLGGLGVSFVVEPCRLPEPVTKPAAVSAEAWALALAHFKAREVAERHSDRWVLGADTIVRCGGRILGKPRDPDDARAMLELQARVASDVITGVCLLHRGQGRRWLACASTRVYMRDDPELREEYLASGDWAGKAGAYGIQTVGDRLVERIEGSFTNVVGLPVGLVERMLGQALKNRPVRGPGPRDG